MTTEIRELTDALALKLGNGDRQVCDALASIYDALDTLEERMS